MHRLFVWKASEAAARGFQYGTSSIQGRRPSQEDRFSVVEKLPGSKGGCSFVAVYDGHGGHRAAAYATEAMHKHLVKSSGYKVSEMSKALQEAALWSQELPRRAQG